MPTFQPGDKVTGIYHEGLEGVVERVTDDGCLVVLQAIGDGVVERVEGDTWYWKLDN
jgi:uncharacterized protein YijF (DUF1287 family)